MGRNGNRIGDAALYRRGELITALARGLFVGLGLLGLFLLCSRPHTRPLPALAVGAGYIGYSLASRALIRRHPLWRRRAKVAHMVETLIEVGRIEQEGERILDVRRHDLKEVAAVSTHPLRLRAEKKGVALSFEFPGEPLYVQGDVRSAPGQGSVFSVRLPRQFRGGRPDAARA